MKDKFKDFEYDDLTTLHFHTDIMNLVVKYIMQTEDIPKCYSKMVKLLESYDSSCFKSSKSQKTISSH